MPFMRDDFISIFLNYRENLKVFKILKKNNASAKPKASMIDIDLLSSHTAQENLD